MFPLKSSESTSSTAHAETELAFWEQLATFSFDMDKEPHGATTGDESSYGSRRARSNSQPLPGRSEAVSEREATLPSEFAITTGAPSLGIAHPHSFGSLIPHEGYPPPGIYYNSPNHDHSIEGNPLFPSHSLDFLLSQFPPSQGNQEPYIMMQRMLSSLGPTSFPTGFPSLPNTHIMAGSHSSGARLTHSEQYFSPSNPGTASSSRSLNDSHEAEGTTEAEQNTIAEEKRRRNTAASARFRIKKKQRTTNLERSVSDLSGRAEDLEREAADLRRENGWLKEIVMLKGSRLAAVNLASHLIQSNRGGSEDHQSNALRPPDEGTSDSGESSGHSNKNNLADKKKKKGREKK